ncbi:MAG: SDR family oxidoreductase [Candidatus Omnitrophica bacterium]|nr:SDR family oxidoreductase [Candidatus Omnitrophota bacterium]
MDVNLKNKVALVCASSQGMGYACAALLAKAGAHIIICARRKGLLRAAAEKLKKIGPGRVLSIQADVSKQDDIKRVVTSSIKSFKTINILINNAGGPHPGTIESLTDHDWYEAINLNLMSTIRFSSLVVPHMKKKKWGRIINIVSIAAKAPIKGMGLSNTVRAAVLGFAKTLSQEVSQYGITVNSLCPGAIATERFERLIAIDAKEAGKSVKEIKKEIASSIPVKFIAEPNDFAQLVLFLASPEARYINGAVISVDGGEYKGLI